MIWKDIGFERGLGGGKLGPILIKTSIEYEKKRGEGERTYEEATVQSLSALSFEGGMHGCIGHPVPTVDEPEFAVHLSFNEPAHAIVYGLHQPASVPI